MWARRIQRMIEKNRDEVVGILLRKYPVFVLSDREGDLGGIAAFVFHDVTPEGLEPMLHLLAENRYMTLTADEYTERMACGCPVIASKAGALPEIADGAALLVNPYNPDEIAEAILKVLFEEGLRKGLVKKGHFRVKAFSWEKCANGTLSVLESI